MLALVVPTLASAQLPVPPLHGHVTDLTNTLTPAQRAGLAQQLSALELRNGAQVAVLLVASTAPESIEQYALRVATQWQLGRKEVDNGAILLIAMQDRTMRIEVGYGLEGALPDITSKRIIQDAIAPKFQRGDYYAGVQAGVENIIQRVDAEPPRAPIWGPDMPPDNRYGNYFFYVPIYLFFMLLLAWRLRKDRHALTVGKVLRAAAWIVIDTLKIIFWIFVLLLMTLGTGGARGRGGFGGGSGLRGGGGSFGGGGASGRW